MLDGRNIRPTLQKRNTTFCLDLSIFIQLVSRGEEGHKSLAAEERSFVYLPFEHSEDMEDQVRFWHYIYTIIRCYSQFLLITFPIVCVNVSAWCLLYYSQSENAREYVAWYSTLNSHSFS